MNVHVTTVSKHCEDCKFLRVVDTSYWANEEVYQRNFVCENYEFCINAIRIYKKVLREGESHGGQGAER